MIKTHTLLAASAVIALRFTAFDNGKWKVDDAGNLMKDSNGNPVFVNTGGGEQSVDGGTISRLNGEAMNHRQRAETAETKLKAFEGIDPAAAKTALETVGKLSEKQLIDAGEVDKVRGEVGKQWQDKVTALETDNTGLRNKLNSTTINNAFATSAFARDKLAIPLDLAQSHFGNRFKIEGDKITATDFNGNTVMSAKRMGEAAEFDEALEIIISNYAGKDSILKGNNHAGTGNGGGGGNPNPSMKTVRRGQYDAMPAHEQARVGQQVAKGEMRVVD